VQDRNRYHYCNADEKAVTTGELREGAFKEEAKSGYLPYISEKDIPWYGGYAFFDALK
jgi:hypothetical protein